MPVRPGTLWRTKGAATKDASASRLPHSRVKAEARAVDRPRSDGDARGGESQRSAACRYHEATSAEVDPTRAPLGLALIAREVAASEGLDRSVCADPIV